MPALSPGGTTDKGALEIEVSPYLLTEPRILRDVCAKLRRDDGGRRCPVCCVRDFCDGQAQRAGRAPRLA